MGGWSGSQCVYLQECWFTVPLPLSRLAHSVKVTVAKQRRKGCVDSAVAAFATLPPPFAKLQPGTTIMADDNIERIPIKNLISEDRSEELATSPDMKPYLEFIKAVVQDHGLDELQVWLHIR